MKRRLAYLIERFNKQKVNLEYARVLKELPLLVKAHLLEKEKKPGTRPRSILIINTGLIGDTIHSLPAMRHFISKSNARVDVVVSPLMRTLFVRMQEVSNVYSSRSVYGRVQENGTYSNKLLGAYDLVLVMRISKDSFQLLQTVRFKELKTYLRPYLKYMVNILESLSGKRKVKQWNVVNFETIGEKSKATKRLEFDRTFLFKKSDWKKVDKLPFLKDAKRKRIVIHTGSGWRKKLWQTNRWVQLVKRIRQVGEFDFIFVGNTSFEEKTFSKIRTAVPFKIYSVIKKLDVKETAMLMKRCHFFIGIDSGPRHIAHMVDLPSISLLGPGLKNFDPLNRHASIIDKSQAKVSLIALEKDGGMDKIHVDDVFGLFRKKMRAHL